MTRGQIIQMARDTLEEDVSTPDGSNPGAWNRLVTTAADQLCRDTWCYYAETSASLVQNQALYCAPALFEINAASVYYPDGSRHTLGMSKVAVMDNTRPGWRNEPAGMPKNLVATALNSFVLFPAPAYNSVVATYVDLVIQATTSKIASTTRSFQQSDVGLQLPISDGTGFNTGLYWIVAVDGNGIATLSNAPNGAPISVGTAASAGGTAALTSGGIILEGWGITQTTPGQPGDWSASTAECPLPTQAHMTVVWGACLLRTIGKATKENALRRSWIGEQYRIEFGKLQAEVVRFTQATREPGYIDGSYPLWEPGPLDY